MILPIIAYGDNVLRKVADEIDASYPDINTLIDNMFLTMYNANGVGLAAPQIGKSIRLFIVDASAFAEDIEDIKEKEMVKNFKKVFINAKITSEEGVDWKYNEGCLSIPKIREDISRKPSIHIQYYDQNFKLCKETYSGIIARVIQHEYDHIEGKLFIDKISPLRRKILSGKLSDISKGKVNVEYKMKFPTK